MQVFQLIVPSFSHPGMSTGSMNEETILEVDSLVLGVPTSSCLSPLNPDMGYKRTTLAVPFPNSLHTKFTLFFMPVLHHLDCYKAIPHIYFSQFWILGDPRPRHQQIQC